MVQAQLSSWGGSSATAASSSGAGGAVLCWHRALCAYASCMSMTRGSGRSRALRATVRVGGTTPLTTPQNSRPGIWGSSRPAPEQSTPRGLTYVFAPTATVLLVVRGRLCCPSCHLPASEQLWHVKRTPSSRQVSTWAYELGWSGSAQASCEEWILQTACKRLAQRAHLLDMRTHAQPAAVHMVQAARCVR